MRKPEIVGVVIGLVVGSAVILFFPQLIETIGQWMVGIRKSQNLVEYSIKGGTPIAGAMGTIIIIFGIVGGTIGWVWKRIFNKK